MRRVLRCVRRLSPQQALKRQISGGLLSTASEAAFNGSKTADLHAKGKGYGVAAALSAIGSCFAAAAAWCTAKENAEVTDQLREQSQMAALQTLMEKYREATVVYNGKEISALAALEAFKSDAQKGDSKDRFLEADKARRTLLSFYEQFMLLETGNSLRPLDVLLTEFPGTSKVKTFVEAGRFVDEFNYMQAYYPKKRKPYDGGAEVYSFLEDSYLGRRAATKEVRDKYKPHLSATEKKNLVAEAKRLSEAYAFDVATWHCECPASNHKDLMATVLKAGPVDKCQQDSALRARLPAASGRDDVMLWLTQDAAAPASILQVRSFVSKATGAESAAETRSKVLAPHCKCQKGPHKL